MVQHLTAEPVTLGRVSVDGGGTCVASNLHSSLVLLFFHIRCCGTSDRVGSDVVQHHTPEPVTVCCVSLHDEGTTCIVCHSHSSSPNFYLTVVTLFFYSGRY